MLRKIYDVVALGELLIDFTQNGVSMQGNQIYEANPGGAPCNVLAMLTKLGKKTAFIGKVGDDQFGYILKNALDEVGINSDNLALDKNVHTTLSFVHTLEGGDRDFSFYRKPGADMMLCADEVNDDVIKSSKVFHFGTLSLTDKCAREATKKAIKIAKENGLIVTFDPNLRVPLWDSLEEAKKQMIFGMKQCDVLKLSEEELSFISGTCDIDKAVSMIKQENDIKLILVTSGSKGSTAFYNGIKVEKKAFVQDKTIETTGAGDTFFACVINYLLDHGFKNLSRNDLKEMLTFANAAASIITTRKGALRVMPCKNEVIEFIDKFDLLTK